MFGKKVKSRIFFLLVTLLLGVAVMFIVLRSLEDNVVYFFSPTEIYNKANIPSNENIRVGGLMVNEVPTWRIDHMPYGGVKESGNTREGIRYAMESMTEERLMILNFH